MSSKFTGSDFYNIDALLTEEERDIRDNTREWVEERFLSQDPTTGTICY